MSLKTFLLIQTLLVLILGVEYISMAATSPASSMTGGVSLANNTSKIETPSTSPTPVKSSATPSQTTTGRASSTPTMTPKSGREGDATNSTNITTTSTSTKTTSNSLTTTKPKATKTPTTTTDTSTVSTGQTNGTTPVTNSTSGISSTTPTVNTSSPKNETTPTSASTMVPTANETTTTPDQINSTTTNMNTTVVGVNETTTITTTEQNASTQSSPSTTAPSSTPAINTAATTVTADPNASSPSTATPPSSPETSTAATTPTADPNATHPSTASPTSTPETGAAATTSEKMTSIITETSTGQIDSETTVSQTTETVTQTDKNMTKPANTTQTTSSAPQSTDAETTPVTDNGTTLEVKVTTTQMTTVISETTTVTDAPPSSTEAISETTTTEPPTTTHIDECQGVDCHNGTCKDLLNNYTCECIQGYTGFHCETDIDECQGVDCHNGTCKNLLNNYTCECIQGYTGFHCETDINECQGVDCHNGICIDLLNNYTCECIPGYTGFHCETDIDECESPNVSCNNGKCIDKVNNYTCDCSTGWEGDNCESNIDECLRELHKCDRNAVCDDTEGSYNCSCKNGFTGDGFSCSDKDECSEELYKDCGNGICFNTIGSFKCFCLQGWEGMRCKQDIDECTNKTDNCDANATCVNTLGGFNCSCDEGFRGNGNKCVYKVLVEIAGDEREFKNGDDEVYGPFYVDGELPYYGKLYNSYFVSVNGYITLGRQLVQTYPPANETDWKSYDIPIIAPLWADIQLGTNGTVRVANVSDERMNVINALFGTLPTNFTNAVVISWTNAVPYPYNTNAGYEKATFQVVIAMTSTNTGVVFNYDQEYFTWKTSYDRHVTVGYSGSDGSGTILFNKTTFTEANKRSSISSDVNGRHVFNVTARDENAIRKLTCYKMARQTDVMHLLEEARNNADICPCTSPQAERDSRFRLVSTGAQHKYQSRFPAYFESKSVFQNCHYGTSGELLTSSPLGGQPEVRNDTVLSDLKSVCCTNSSCDSIFYMVYPSNSCLDYQPPTFVPSWGDPHLKTLDGADFTFNGRGEFILLIYEDGERSSMVQVRTDFVKINETTNKDATVFVGLAIQNNEGPLVTVLLNKTADLYIDGVKNATFGMKSNDVIDEQLPQFSIFSRNKTLIISLQTGIAVEVTVNSALDIVVKAPRDKRYLSKFQGLLGNNDKNNKNDFKFRNGSFVNGAKESDIYPFGISWRVNPSESLFNHTYAAEKGYHFYNNASLDDPRFLSELNSTEIEAYIEDECSSEINITECSNNRACIVDSIASCDLGYGKLSKETEIDADSQTKILDNFPPVINATPNVHIYYGEEFLLHFNITDDNDVNGVHVTVKVEPEDVNHVYHSDNSTMLNISQTFLKMLRNATETLQINITATDVDGAQRVYIPNIYYCGCEDRKQCDFSLSEVNEESSEHFYRALCMCPNDTSGDYCQTKACNCYEGVKCNSGKCDHCPAGLEGDGFKCHDLNECYNKSNLCQQDCTNGEGSYSCGCYNGYRKVDFGSCEDIDECIEGTENCTDTEHCQNTDGGFTCQCLQGYGRNPNTSKCEKGEKVFAGEFEISANLIVPGTNENSIRVAFVKYLKDVFAEVTENFFLEVRLYSLSTRMRRDESQETKYKVEFVVRVNNKETVREETFASLFENKKYFDQDDTVAVRVLNDTFYYDKDGGACLVHGSNACSPISTTCKSNNGTLWCECLQGFEKLNTTSTGCQDINECRDSNKEMVCSGGTCTNTVGNFICTCPAGFLYDKAKLCVDLCSSDPCQNGGTCTHGNVEGQYVCKCSDNWGGQQCEDENSENKKLRTIAIAVGATLGAGCILLLCAIFGMYRRNRTRYRYLDSYIRRPISRSEDHDDNYDLTGSTTFNNSEIRLKKREFPIDDDDTPSNFSIARPQVSSNKYRQSEVPSAYDFGGNNESGKDDEERPLTKSSRRSDTGESLGAENPSFLHSGASANVKTNRSSRGSYEYF